MRLWSVHPTYLDTKGLVALWREALLAQAVLVGQTKGYRHHPQLERFKSQKDPIKAIGNYLLSVQEEAEARGYNFDAGKIVKPQRLLQSITVTRGQMQYELEHLRNKLRERDPERFVRFANLQRPKPHPLFKQIPGPVESWEIIKD